MKKIFLSLYVALTLFVVNNSAFADATFGYTTESGSSNPHALAFNAASYTNGNVTITRTAGTQYSSASNTNMCTAEGTINARWALVNNTYSFVTTDGSRISTITMLAMRSSGGTVTVSGTTNDPSRTISATFTEKTDCANTEQEIFSSAVGVDNVVLNIPANLRLAGIKITTVTASSDCPVPQNVNAEALCSEQANISWEASTADSYKVYVEEEVGSGVGGEVNAALYQFTKNYNPAPSQYGASALVVTQTGGAPIPSCNNSNNALQNIGGLNNSYFFDFSLNTANLNNMRMFVNISFSSSGSNALATTLRYKRTADAEWTENAPINHSKSGSSGWTNDILLGAIPDDFTDTTIDVQLELKITNASGMTFILDDLLLKATNIPYASITGSPFVPESGTTVLLTTLEGGNTYRYRVESLCGTETSTSEWATFTTNFEACVVECADIYIDGDGAVCENNTSTYRLVELDEDGNEKSKGGSATYDWSVTGGSIQSGAGTDEITVSWGAASEGALVSVSYRPLGTEECVVGDQMEVSFSQLAIVTQPSTQNRTVEQGYSAGTLTVVANGANAYQWYQNTTASTTGATPVSGATTNTLTVPTDVLGTFYYYCEITGRCSETETSSFSGAYDIITPSGCEKTISEFKLGYSWEAGAKTGEKTGVITEIDTETGTITVELPAGIARNAVTTLFTTVPPALQVLYQGQAISSGATNIDYSCPVELTVVNSTCPEDSKIYTVYVTNRSGTSDIDVDYNEEGGKIYPITGGPITINGKTFTSAMYFAGAGGPDKTGYYAEFTIPANTTVTLTAYFTSQQFTFNGEKRALVIYDYTGGMQLAELEVVCDASHSWIEYVLENNTAAEKSIRLYCKQGSMTVYGIELNNENIGGGGTPQEADGPNVDSTDPIITGESATKGIIVGAVCNGDEAIITLNKAEYGIQYQLYANAQFDAQGKMISEGIKMLDLNANNTDPKSSDNCGALEWRIVPSLTDRYDIVTKDPNGIYTEDMRIGTSIEVQPCHFKSTAEGNFTEPIWNVSFNVGEVPVGEEVWEEELVPVSGNPDGIIVADGHTITLNTAAGQVETFTIEAKGKFVLDEGANIEVDVLTIHSNEGASFNERTYSGEFLNTGGDIQLNSHIRVEKDFKKVVTADSWSYIAFPFTVAKTTNITGEPLTLRTDYYIRYYDGASRAEGNYNYTMSENWKSIADLSNSKGKGYIIAIDTDLDKTTNNKLVFESAQNDDAVRALLAPVTTTTIPVTPYESEYDVNAGWNLIGNPYLSSFDLSNLKENDETPKVYVFDRKLNTTTSDGYATHDDIQSYKLAPFESIFLQATTSEVQFNVPETKSMTLRSSAAIAPFDYIELNFGDASYRDYYRTDLRAGATNGFDLNKDGLKLKSSNVPLPLLSASMGGQSYAFNAIPAPSAGEEVIVPLTYSVPKAGTYSFTTATITPNITTAILRDTKANIDTDLLEQSEYLFVSEKKESNDSRFQLILGAGDEEENTTDLAAQKAGEMALTVSGRQITLAGAELPATIRVYDVSGRQVAIFNNVANNHPVSVDYMGVVIIKAESASQSIITKAVMK